jgi:hypothetical protein
VNTLFMLSPDPHFDYHFVAYLKDDPAQEPIAIGYSIPRILADPFSNITALCRS